MIKMKKNLLVTLADRNYIDQAKQLFSSVYWNAGWKGDYMLLAHEIPEKELKWFRDKGILIKKCKPPYDKQFPIWPSCVLNKFYLFTSYFKKWKNIIFLDADIIVRASLNELTKIKGFAAASAGKLLKMFIGSLHARISKIDKQILKKLKENYDLKEHGFNTGVMAFSTDLIKKNTFSKLKKLFEFYNEVGAAAEQPIINLLFYKKWIKLPTIYNINPCSINHYVNIKPEKIKGIILHFNRYRPWDPRNYFYKEWNYNLDKAELINLNKIPSNIKKWTKQEIKNYLLYLKKRQIKYSYKYFFWKTNLYTKRFIDKNIGLFGIFLKNNFPRLYFKIKRLENEKS